MASLLDTLKMIPSQLAAAVPKVGKATGLAGGRLGIDALQGLSGLYDLTTPGIGTNQVTKGLNNAAFHLDQIAQNQGINPAYRIMQASLSPAAFFAPGGVVSKFSKGADILDKTVPAIKDTGAASRIANQAFQQLKPINAINSIIGTGNTLGHMSGQGTDINPMNGGLAAALNLIAPLALPAAGQGALEAGPIAGQLYGKAARAQTSRTVLRQQIQQLDGQTAGLRQRISTLPSGDSRSWDLLQRKIDNNEAMKQRLLSNQ